MSNSDLRILLLLGEAAAGNWERAGEIIAQLKADELTAVRELLRAIDTAATAEQSARALRWLNWQARHSPTNR